ncbi:MAG: hypothetical protein JSS29_12130 [Proteobacteria bacterium]|nr:hypothetical protein [Pseudomonadota bacterium]
MSAHSRAASRAPGVLTRRTLSELGELQEAVQRHRAQRDAALRLLTASRQAATDVAQREFWLEFVWADQEYRVAVRRLAEFCVRHQDLGGVRSHGLAAS